MGNCTPWEMPCHDDVHTSCSLALISCHDVPTQDTAQKSQNFDDFSDNIGKLDAGKIAGVTNCSHGLSVGFRPSRLHSSIWVVCL